MNPNPHNIRCFLCDLRKAWQGLRREKVARWTICVHVVYFAQVAAKGDGAMQVTAIACALILSLELFADHG